MTDQELEQRLRAWYRAQVGENETAPLSLRRDVAAIPRTSSPRARWFGPGRGVILLAAATLLLVGGAMAAGSGLAKLPSLVPPVPAPTNPVAVASPTTAPSAVPSAAVVQPASGLILFKTKPDGARYAAVPNGSWWITAANGPLWIANADGTGKRELNPGSCEGWPAWSPDGTRVLVSRIDHPRLASAADPCGFFVNLGDPGTRLYLTDASGSAPQLVDTGCVDPCVSEFDGVFSSDGRQILFVRLIDVPDPSATGIAGKPAPKMQVEVLATMDLGTGRVTELAHLPTGSEVPAWSPDRSKIVFNWVRPVPPTSSAAIPQDAGVFVADAGGRNVHRVSPAGWESGGGSWSPDGSLILFGRNNGTLVGSSDIYTVRPDGTEVRRLTTDGISGLAAWGVDGRIWFVRTPHVDANAPTPPPSVTWVMNADGGNATQSSLGPQPQDLAANARQPMP